MAAIVRFGPAVALMALIFLLSAQPDLSSGLGGWDLLLRKLAHMIEYGLLFALWWRALRDRTPWAAVAIAIAYACTDEIHQGFVDGRHGTPVDVLVDAAGAGVAWLAIRRFGMRRAR